MYYEVTMAVGKTRDDLTEKGASLFLAKLAALLVTSDILEEISTSCILHDQGKLILGLNDFE